MMPTIMDHHADDQGVVDNGGVEVEMTTTTSIQHEKKCFHEHDNKSLHTITLGGRLVHALKKSDTLKLIAGVAGNTLEW